MKRQLLFIILVFASVFVFSQKEIKVMSFKQSSSDISARVNQREDPKGEVCALVKVQLPIRNAFFDGDIIGKIAYKTNEYWVYMSHQSSRLEIKIPGFKPLTVTFDDYNIPALKSKDTYELCVIENEADSPLLYNEGMTALAKNDLATAYETFEKASEDGYAPAAYILGEMSLIPFDKKYDEDPNTTESYQEAYNFYKKAVDGGNPKAMYALGVLLLEYQKKNLKELSNIEVDPTLLEESNIRNMIGRAAEEGVVGAQYLMISDEKWCDENAAKGIAIAEFGKGLRYDEELSTDEYPMLESLKINRTEDFGSAISWYRKAANHGLDVAQWRLGEMIARGLGIEINIEEAIEWRAKAAEQGNPIFQYMMGIMFSYGDFTDFCTYYYSDCNNYRVDVPVDADKADYWMRKLDQKELSKSEKRKIELRYQETIDELCSLLKKNEEFSKAIYWYQREIELGYRDGYYNLGRIYYDGNGASPNYQKARNLFENAILANENYDKWYSDLRSNALCYMGLIYRDGLGVEVDKDKAKEYFMRSINDRHGDLLIPAMPYYELGNMYYDDSIYEEAINCYAMATSYCGDIGKLEDDLWVCSWLNEYSTLAHYKLGMMYLNGIGTERNLKDAIDNLSKAASRGNKEAKIQLRLLGYPENLEDLRNLFQAGERQYYKKNYDKAIKYFKQAAEQGYAFAQYYMGYIYMNGQGVAIDYSEGIKWTRLSAEKGYHKAQELLGWYYENGKGVTKNYTEAVRWYRLAAKQNSSYAIRQLKRLNEM